MVSLDDGNATPSGNFFPLFRLFNERFEGTCFVPFAIAFSG